MVQAVVYRRADAAAVNAIASGSQHSTIRAISHRIACSGSVSTPSSLATYRTGAASVSCYPPLAVTLARSLCRLAKVAATSVRSPTSPARALCWPSMVAKAVLVLPRFVASSIAESI